MILYPSIDILNGEVVRLKRGDFSFVAKYPGSPLDYAKKWQDAGAAWLHLVDLDGAVHGEFRNFGWVEKIVKETKLKVELGGGVRTLDQIKTAIDIGVSRIIVGTRAVDSDFVGDILSKFGDKIAIGMDVKDGLVRTHGWKSATAIHQNEFLKNLEEMKAKYVVWTDISKDGMMEGPNIAGLNKVLEFKKLDVILSGGMSSLDDLTKLMTIKASNFNGVIIGRALYEHKIDLKQAFDLVSARC
ncbi:MAG: 1-(5-phosphoribosyl)-5-[(5-phosphoribosylamino)methylideneamino]imidazole-4-carboxamide isomerase [Candidatus Omnitrophica bacterium]|nr:1-(5-phosphoribosyl)-5-[(5-phosphoribosylamino)methylideneamino]imidazole-4-carboxamide isomerase [Candidatus Omnitrophota bacterium]